MDDISDFVNQLNAVINHSSNVEKNASTVSIVNAENNIGKINTAVATESLTIEIDEHKDSTPIKILIVSTHINQINGHSRIAYNLVQELAKNKWIKVVHFATQKIMGADNGRRYPDNVKVIDGTQMEKQKHLGLGLKELPEVIQIERPNIVFIYDELHVICSYIEEIRKGSQDRFFKIWSYIDTTYKAFPPTLIDMINRDVERVFCLTKAWKNEFKLHGITRPVDVLHYSVDTKVFRPVPMELARQTLGLPKDIFLFTCLNRNIPHKRLDILLMAFVKLIIQYPMKPIFLLVVADKGEKGGHQLFDIFARELKLNNAPTSMYGNRFLLTTRDVCYKDEDMNLLYNCGNVGITCADGEGFGLCTLEQMVTGVPQIVPDIDGFKEYCNDMNTIMVKPTIRYYHPQVYSMTCGEGNMVSYEDVAKAMEQYVFDEDLVKMNGKNALSIASKYTRDKACEILIKRLKQVREDDE